MIEILSGALFVTIVAVLYLANKVSRTGNKMRIAEEKVKAHEKLQKIDEDIANGGDSYISRILRDATRTVRSDKTNNDIGE